MLKTLVLTCDHCEVEGEDLTGDGETKDECLQQAFELGWYMVRGPQRDLGWDGEKIYCCDACLVADLS